MTNKIKGYKPTIAVNNYYENSHNNNPTTPSIKSGTNVSTELLNNKIKRNRNRHRNNIN